jgi:hypothetical protein
MPKAASKKGLPVDKAIGDLESNRSVKVPREVIRMSPYLTLSYWKPIAPNARAINPQTTRAGMTIM